MRTKPERKNHVHRASPTRSISTLWRFARRPALILVGITIAFVGLWLTVSPENEPARWLQLGFGAVVVTSVIVSPRFPLFAVFFSASATAAAWLFGLTADPFLLTGFVVFRLAEVRGAHKFPWWMFVSAVVVLSSAVMVGTEQAPDRFRGMLVGAVVLSVAWVLGVRTREVKNEAVARSQTQERLRLAREVHDVLSHSLGTIGVRAGIAAYVEGLSEIELRGVLHGIEVDARTSMSELQALLQRERGEIDARDTPSIPLSSALVSVARTAERAGVDAQLEMDETVDALPTEVSTTVLRIVQEGLTNVVRHGAASTAVVRVSVDADSVAITISDDGRGAQGAVTFGNGLTGMRERAEILGGSVEVASAASGFTVQVTLPLQASIQDGAR